MNDPASSDRLAHEEAIFPVTQPIALGAIPHAKEVASSAYVEQTARNRAIIEDFVRILYAERDPRRAFETYVDERYLQHNPGIPDGREAALMWLEPVFSSPSTEIQVRRVLVDGEFATVQIVGRMNANDPGSAIINIFRIQRGLILEHWDVTQAMPSQTASGRPLG